MQLDTNQQSVSFGDVAIQLTGTEFRLLECLFREPGQAFTRAELMESCIAGGAIVLERTIDQHICSLRRKLGRWLAIETARGIGYRLGAQR